SLELSVYDLGWIYRPEATRTTIHYKRPSQPLPKPIHYEEMLEIARNLSQGFPEVRIDLYEVNGKVYFGEMTFTSAGGFMNYYTDEFLLELGNMVDLEKA
ncbi:MAG: glycosyltransferase, partial [Bacteroidales bacterium]|nr:glycosyltransferase [Bacteroidales bacterium]